MTVATPDVLWTGPWEPAELASLEQNTAIHLERTTSLVGAMGRLARGPARVVLLAADAVLGSERDAVSALRDAGAQAIVMVYRPTVAHRAPQATANGADAAVVLPAHPGELSGAVDRLLRAATAAATTRDPAAAPGRIAEDAAAGFADTSPTARVPLEPLHERPPPTRGTLETLVGDAALVHRAVGDLDRLMDQILGSFRRRSSATRSSLLLVDRSRDELVMQRAEGLPDREAWAPIPLGEGLAGRVAATGRALLVQDSNALRAQMGRSPASAGDRRARSPGYRTDSCLILPLAATEGVVGVICLADKADGQSFDEADLRSLSFLADQAGQALENSLKLRHMQDLAVVDELTGLYNRRYFQRALAREVQRARRYDRPLTVAIMDLDRFKQFNDLCGHPAGDRALALVGEILRTALREVDIVARHGGEEFAVILPETSASEEHGSKNPFPFLERLRRQVEEATIDGEEKLPSGRLTISIGVACFPDDATSAEDLFQKADDALYVSKERGRNCVSYRGRPVQI